MNSKQKGSLGQIAVSKKLAELGLPVFTEVGDLSKIDLITVKDGKLIRLQVKNCKIVNGSLEVPLRACGPNFNYYYTASDFDVLAVYSHELDKVYFIPSSIFATHKSQIKLRVIPSLNKQETGTNQANQFLIFP